MPHPKRGGRVKGTPNKATREVKALAGLYTAEVIDALIEIVRTQRRNPAAQVAAARELLDRGHGRPAQSVDLPGVTDGSLMPTRVIFELHH